MADLLQFPATLEREWRAAETNLRRMVEGVTHDPVALQHCIDQLKPAFIASARSLTVPLDPKDPEAAVTSINSWLQDLICSLLSRLLVLELELYGLRGTQPGGGGRRIAPHSVDGSAIGQAAPCDVALNRAENPSGGST